MRDRTKGKIVIALLGIACFTFGYALASSSALAQPSITTSTGTISTDYLSPSSTRMYDSKYGIVCYTNDSSISCVKL